MEPRVFASWLDGLSVAVICFDREGTMVFANASALRLLPLDGPPVALEQWPSSYGIFLADGRTPVAAGDLPIRQALNGRSAEGPSLLLRNDRVPNGAHVLPSAGAWRDASGTLIGAVLLLQDETAQYREMEALRTSHLFLESVLENIPAMIFVKDAKELRFERFNRAGEELLGQPRELLLGRNDYDFFPKEQADHFQRIDRETLEQRTLVDIPEEPIQTASGERWLHTKKIPVLDDEGNPLYLLGISLDITARKLAEDALKKAHEELELRVRERTTELVQANADLQREIAERLKAEAALRQSQKMEAIGRLAGGVAHDFNNMLTAILAYAQMLLERLPAGDPQRYELEQILLAGERAAGLTRQLLAFSRRQVLQPVVMDLGEAVHGMEGMLRRLIGEDVDLQVVRAPDLGWVMADPGQMQQVILNLAVNARDAMPKGGRLVIETMNALLPDEGPTPAPALAYGSYVCMSVTDTGVGMPAEVMAHIFEPFFTTKPHGQGTGLGLPMAFGIVKQSGGDLVVSSDAGRGSVFRVYLPRCPAPVDAGQPALGTDVPVLHPGGATVLLVEDEMLVRRTVQAMLESLGYRVIPAVDAAEALRVFGTTAGQVDLLLTDLVMPGLSGRDLADGLRQIRPDLAVLFMSGHTDSPPAQGPGTAFLQKPFTPATLAACIRDILASPRPQSGA